MSFANFTRIKTADFAESDFECSCGHKHSVKTGNIVIGENAFLLLKDVAMKIMPAGKVLFVTSEDIPQNYRVQIESELNKAGYIVVTHVFTKNLKADIKQCGELFKYSEDVRLVIVFGSGSVCDLAKYYAGVNNNKLIVIPSAPSNNGYLADISCLYVNGVKEKLKSIAPHALICDLKIMNLAPQNMKAAGFGDVCSSITALLDWYFAKRIIGEHYCENIANLVNQCIDMCISVGSGLIDGSENSTYILSEAVIRSSLCIQLLGSDRCISGAEHHIADIISPIRENIKSILYGEKVFLAHKYLISLYRLFFTKKFIDVLMPVDKSLHAEKLAQLTNTDFFMVLAKMDYDMSIETYKIRSYKIEEYRSDIINLIQKSEIKTNAASVIFKRIYADAGFWINGAIKDKEIKTAVALASDFNPDYTILAQMRNAGLLEKYLIM